MADHTILDTTRFYAPEAEEADGMDDMASPEGGNAAEIQAQLEKRHAEVAS